MKKRYYLIIIYTLILSCKKEHSEKAGSTLYPVSFNISHFDAETAAFNKINPNYFRSHALAVNALSGLTNLVYSVYDASGNYVHSIQQNSTQTSFGTITDNLPAGTYTVSFVGFQNNDSEFRLVGFDAVTLATENINYGNTNGYFQFADTFVNTESITITNLSLNQNINLDRINGELELNIEDPLPSNTGYITFVIANSYWKYNIAKSAIDTSEISPVQYGGYVSKSYLGKSNYNLTGILLNTIHPFAVTITCRDTSFKVIASKTIYNVYCQVNKKTILTGTLFGSPAGSTGGFKTLLDTLWNSVQDTISFSKSKSNTGLIKH